MHSSAYAVHSNIDDLAKSVRHSQHVKLVLKTWRFRFTDVHMAAAAAGCGIDALELSSTTVSALHCAATSDGEGDWDRCNGIDIIDSWNVCKVTPWDGNAAGGMTNGAQMCVPFTAPSIKAGVCARLPLVFSGTLGPISITILSCSHPRGSVTLTLTLTLILTLHITQCTSVTPNLTMTLIINRY